MIREHAEPAEFRQEFLSVAYASAASSFSWPPAARACPPASEIPFLSTAVVDEVEYLSSRLCLSSCSR